MDDDVQSGRTAKRLPMYLESFNAGMFTLRVSHARKQPNAYAAFEVGGHQMHEDRHVSHQVISGVSGKFHPIVSDRIRRSVCSLLFCRHRLAVDFVFRH